MAALRLGDDFVAARRSRRNRARSELCAWLDKRSLRYMPPQGNFVLFEIGRDVAELIPRMLADGVAVGRRFDTVERWMRVAMGTDREMEKFQRVLMKVLA